ncbi:MAG: hypothetical protein COB35_12765 [Gammaproteobacteria bacterium]|nr:MAG: hypothetical protein COB35_12765 [Gammaproteobacteria bacterium]
MDNRTLETNARITTQQSLKKAAKLFKSLFNKYETYFQNNPLPKCSRKRQHIEQSRIIEIFTQGRLIHKRIMKENNRTSKHTTTQWLYLDHDEEHPFEHFEEQLFPISEILLNSRKPTEPEEHAHAIFIKRHSLERIAQRLNKTELEDILSPLHPYIVGLIYFQNKFQQQIENNKFIMLTKDAYLIITMKPDRTNSDQEPGYILTTILPKKIWSKRRIKILSPWVNALIERSKTTAIKNIEPILILKPSQINTENNTQINVKNTVLIFG